MTAGRYGSSAKIIFIYERLTQDRAEAESIESELHLRIAAMRSIEARRDMVRAVNFGPTSWVDAAGRVRGRYASVTPGVLLTEPALLETPLTFYMRLGDLPFAVLLVAAVAGAARKRITAP